MGFMNSSKNWASDSENLYLAIITSFKLQFWSFGILTKLPSFEKYFLLLRPRQVNFLGNLPKSSIIWARWSSFFPKESLLSLRGLNKSYPVNISKVIHAKDHISALKLYFDPVKTSGPRYCLVWISVAKWWCYQQAFPRSAIFTLKPFSSFGPLSRTSLVENALNSSFVDFLVPGDFFFLILGDYYFLGSAFLWAYSSFSNL